MFVKVISGNYLGISAKHRGRKIDTCAILYGEQDGRRKVVGLGKGFGASVTDPDRFQRRLHGGELNSRSGSVLVLIDEVVVHNKRFLFLYLSEPHYALMQKIPKTLRDVLQYGLQV